MSAIRINNGAKYDRLAPGRKPRKEPLLYRHLQEINDACDRILSRAPKRRVRVADYGKAFA